MPFTPTHMLAGLPVAAVWRGPGIGSALIIGTMIPDWPLYIPLGPAYEVTHSFQGVFTASLPLGLAVVLLFQYILKRPLYELLPLGAITNGSGEFNKPKFSKVSSFSNFPST